jgi:hypothetical protein
MFSKNPAHYLLVNVHAEGQRDLLGNSRTCARGSNYLLVIVMERKVEEDRAHTTAACLPSAPRQSGTACGSKEV